MNRNRQPTHPKWGFIVALIAIFIVTMSCDIPSSSNDSAKLTLAALDVKATVDAQQNINNAEATNQALLLQSTKDALDMQGTIQAQQALLSAVPPTAEPPTAEPPTQEPPPPAQTEEPSSEETEESEDVPQLSEKELDEKIKAAKILLFEDMSGTGWYRYVQEGVDLGEWSYTDVGSAQGWFKDNLLSTTKWDLIIAASESRTKIQGEFFVYLMDHLKRGTAVIIEHWALDNLSQGKVAPILAKCGIGIYRDWFVALGTVPNLSVWALKPDHPIFTYPNEGISLRRYTNFWVNDTDKGDLLKITSGGDAELVAGTIADRKSDHGTIASCMEGRLIIMTQSSHEYYREDITRLWENVTYQALKARFTTAP
ncbi:MAG: hypothetical protein JW908_14225 [Anaerolineales bacterium]|nr:hypothetical protein [Anaerolineales bacterium]